MSWKKLCSGLIRGHFDFSYDIERVSVTTEQRHIFSGRLLRADRLSLLTGNILGDYSSSVQELDTFSFCQVTRSNSRRDVSSSS